MLMNIVSRVRGLELGEPRKVSEQGVWPSVVELTRVVRLTRRLGSRFATSMRVLEAVLDRLKCRTTVFDAFLWELLLPMSTTIQTSEVKVQSYSGIKSGLVEQSQ
jgi:hypothetical protein